MRRIFKSIYLSLSRVLGQIRRVVKAFFNTLLLLLDQLLGTVPNLVRANRIVERKLQNLQEEGILSSDQRLLLKEEEIRVVFDADLKRLERIEEKARSTVIGIALSVSLASPGVLLFVQPEILADEASTYKLVTAILFALAITFLSVSGYLSLSAYKISPIMHPRLEDNKSLTSTESACKALLLSRDYNVYRIIQKANLLSASMDCLRNGLLLLVVFIVLSLGSALM